MHNFLIKIYMNKERHCEKNLIKKKRYTVFFDGEIK